MSFLTCLTFLKFFHVCSMAAAESGCNGGYYLHPLLKAEGVIAVTHFELTHPILKPGFLKEMDTCTLKNFISLLHLVLPPKVCQSPSLKSFHRDWKFFRTFTPQHVSWFLQWIVNRLNSRIGINAIQCALTPSTLSICIEKNSEQREFFDEQSCHHVDLIVHLAGKETDLPIKGHTKQLQLTTQGPSEIQWAPSPPWSANEHGFFYMHLFRSAGKETLIFSLTDESAEEVSLSLNFLPFPEGNFSFCLKGNPDQTKTSMDDLSPFLLPAKIKLKAPVNCQLSDFIFWSENNSDIEINAKGEVTVRSGKIGKIFAQCLNITKTIDLFQSQFPEKVLTFHTAVPLTLDGLHETASNFPRGTQIPTSQQMQNFYHLWGSLKAYSLPISISSEQEAWLWVKKENSEDHQLFNFYTGQIDEPEKENEFYFAAFLMDTTSFIDFFEQGQCDRPWPSDYIRRRISRPFSLKKIKKL